MRPHKRLSQKLSVKRRTIQTFSRRIASSKHYAIPPSEMRVKRRLMRGFSAWSDRRPARENHCGLQTDTPHQP
jgi:hypothetical protein